MIRIRSQYYPACAAQAAEACLRMNMGHLNAWRVLARAQAGQRKWFRALHAWGGAAALVVRRGARRSALGRIDKRRCGCRFNHYPTRNATGTGRWRV